MSEQNKTLVREITEQIWNAGAFDRIPEFYSVDYVADYRPYAQPRHGHDGIRGMVERAHAAFPDYHEEIREMVAEGNVVVVRLTITGTQSGQWGVLAPTGKRVSFDEVVFLEIRDGKVVSQRGVADNLTALRQLGVGGR
jgi:predicted ester cyclase